MEEVKKKQAISVSEVKEILEKNDPENMDQIHRWTYDYVSKFTKVDPKAAKKMKQDLVKDCELTEEEAVEIINIMPTTLACKSLLAYSSDYYSLTSSNCNRFSSRIKVKNISVFFVLSRWGIYPLQ